MFGQYSPNAQTRRSKTQMIAEVARDHGFILDKTAANLIARNTLDYTAPDGTRRVRLHDTDVVTFAPNGAITLNSGGWQTMTSKDRMNQALPAGWSVFADRGWFVRTPQGTFPYMDGAQFKPDGTPMHLSRLQRAEAKVRAEKLMVARFLKKAREKGWPDPAGDPWTFTPDVGRETMMDWIRTGYFTARMMQLALQHGGFREAGVAIHMHDMARHGGKPSGIAVVKLRKYIYSQLGIA